MSDEVRALLVDDQPIVAQAVRRMLAGEADITLRHVADPSTALAVLAEYAPTVILQDLIMPEMNGLELVRAYRADPRFRDVPVIVLSTIEDVATKTAAFAAGAHDYLVKLPERGELLARLRYHSTAYTRLLERNAAHQELEQAHRFIRQVFGRYLSDELVESLLERPDRLRLGGERRHVTMVMADLRGFTAATETMPPEDVVRLLNHHLGTMTDVILEHKGTVDELIGDAALAVFGMPAPRPDDAWRAVLCAVRMQQAITWVDAQNEAAGLPLLEMGIGVHTGDVVVGNIGSSRRQKHSVVGSHVNLVSRIEACAVGGQILISDATLEAIGRERLVLGRTLEIEVKGVRGTVRVHDVLGLADAEDGLLLRRDARMRPVEPPMPVELSLLDGKLRADLSAATVVAISDVEAELAQAPALRLLADVRLVLPGVDPVYAKVVTRPNETGTITVRFTSGADALRRLARR